jgi:DNA-binding response OmpR family regulator
MKPTTILLIDDDRAMLEIVQTNLEPEGYRVLGAANGVEGLRTLKAERPDLVVLDVLMPEMNGWEVLRKIEEDPQTAGIPVIMLTAVSGDEDVVKGLEGGAVEYITKPFFPLELVARVKILLRVFDPALREDYREHHLAKRRRALLARHINDT